MANPVVHFEVTGKDAQQLATFYSQLFDWKVDTNNPYNYGMVDNQGAGINGGIGGVQSPDEPGHVTFYVQAPDLQAALDRAGQLGGKTIMPPMEIPGAATIAMFADPQGHVIGLIKG